ANHRHTQHSTASPRMFGPALVQHRLPAGKIAGSGMVGRRPRLGRKPGESRLHMWVFESIIYHFAVAAEYLLQSGSLFTFAKHSTVFELPSYQLGNHIFTGRRTHKCFENPFINSFPKFDKPAVVFYIFR